MTGNTLHPSDGADAGRRLQTCSQDMRLCDISKSTEPSQGKGYVMSRVTKPGHHKGCQAGQARISATVTLLLGLCYENKHPVQTAGSLSHPLKLDRTPAASFN